MQVEKNTNTLDGLFSKFNIKSLASAAGVGVLVTAFTKLASAVVNFGKGAVQSFSEFETIKTNLEVVLGSAQLAEDVFTKVKKIAAATPFGVQDLASATTQLIQSGVALENLEKTLRMLGDAAGGSKDKFNRIIANYTQIMSVGKSSTMDTRQFAMMGLPIYKTLEELGVKGQATASEIEKAFEKMTSAGGAFYNGMAKNSQTLSGKISTLKDTFEEFSATFAETTGLSSGVKFLTESFTSFFELMNFYMENPDLSMKDFFGTFFGNKESVEKHVKEQFDSLSTAEQVTEITNAIKEQRKRIQQLNADKQEFAKYNSSDADIMYNHRIDEAIQKLYYLESVQTEVFAKLEKETKESNFQNEMSKIKKEFDNAIKDINTSYEETDKGKKLELLKELENKLKEYESYKDLTSDGTLTGVKLSEEQLSKLGVVIEDVKNKIIELKKELNGIGSNLTWQEYFKQLTNVQVNGNDGFGAATDFNSTKRNELNKKLETDEFVTSGKNKKAIYNSYIKEYENLIASLLNKDGLDESFKTTDKTIQALVQTLEKLKNEAEGVTESSGFTNIFEKTKSEAVDILNKKASGGNVSNEEFKGAVGKYAGLTAMSALGEAMSGTDAGTFLQSWAQSGNVIMAVIETVIGGIVKVFTSIDGFSDILNGVTELVSRFKPILEPIVEFLVEMTEDAYASFEIFDLIAEVLKPFIQLLSKFAQVFSVPMKLIGMLANKLREWFSGVSDFFEDFSKWIEEIFAWLDYGDTELKQEKDEELQRLKELNAQYKSLSEMIKEQEEYYLKQRQAINADSYKDKILNVNDMILTPQGTFSTHPDDYLIATKNPYSLGGNSKVVMNVNINNNASDVVEARAVEKDNGNGIKELFVTISKKIAQDVAKGDNGWDSALMNRDLRIKGRRIVS